MKLAPPLSDCKEVLHIFTDSRAFYYEQIRQPILFVQSYEIKVIWQRERHGKLYKFTPYYKIDDLCSMDIGDGSHNPLLQYY